MPFTPTRNLFNTQYILERNRYAWIDYARGICIILVCYRHSFEGLINANFPVDDYPVLKLLNSSLVTFRMALFFLISGVFIAGTLYKKGYAVYVIDRFKVLIYPLLVWGCIQITLQLVFKHYTNAKRVPADYLNLILMPRKIEQFWYLNTLFMVGIVYAFFKNVLKFRLWQLMLTAVIFYVADAFFYSTKFNMRYELLTYSFIPDLLHYYIFFFIGDVISAFILNESNKQYLTSFKLLIPLFLFFLATHYYYTTINNYYNNVYYTEYYMPASFLLIALSGCMLTIQISFILQRYKVLKFLRVIGYHSLYIYLMHVMITSFSRAAFSRFVSIPVLLLISVAAGVVIPMIAYNILVRSGFWWLFSLKKPTHEIEYHAKHALS